MVFVSASWTGLRGDIGALGPSLEMGYESNFMQAKQAAK
jgi:hypothetical protein